MRGRGWLGDLLADSHDIGNCESICDIHFKTFKSIASFSVW